MRACCGSTARVANHSSKIPDDENRLMSKILKLPQFAQYDRVPEMDIGRGWIDPKLHPQWATKRQLFA
jgi:hypothetical protein